MGGGSIEKLAIPSRTLELISTSALSTEPVISSLITGTLTVPSFKPPIDLKKALPPFRASSEGPTASPPFMSTEGLKPLSPHILFGGKVYSPPPRDPKPEQNFPTGEELFPHTPLVTPSKEKPAKKIITDLRSGVCSPETGSPDLIDKDPTHRNRSPKTDAQGEYVLVFDWPPNWATREDRLDGEAVWPLDISEINLRSTSPVVGQIGNIIRPVEFSGGAKFGNDNYNQEFSVCMNGITVLGYAFGPKVFCDQIRQKLIHLKGTYVIFQYFKCKAKVPTCLPVNHEVEIVITRRTILTQVTVQKDYKDFKARPTNPEKQCFARMFGQGHKTPAAVKESARKQKQREPNAKKKLLMLDGQKKIFEYVKDPVTCPSSASANVAPGIVDPATDPFADLRSVSPIYSISTKLPNPSRAPPSTPIATPTVSKLTPVVVMGATSGPLSVASLSSVSRSPGSSIQTPSSV